MIVKGEQVMVHSYTSKSPGIVQKFIAMVDPKTGEIAKKFPKMLKKGQVAHM